MVIVLKNTKKWMIEERKRTKNRKMVMIMKGGKLCRCNISESCGSTLQQWEHQCNLLHVAYLNRRWLTCLECYYITSSRFHKEALHHRVCLLYTVPALDHARDVTRSEVSSPLLDHILNQSDQPPVHLGGCI
jgi:hypothetical protein